MWDSVAACSSKPYFPGKGCSIECTDSTRTRYSNMCAGNNTALRKSEVIAIVELVDMESTKMQLELKADTIIAMISCVTKDKVDYPRELQSMYYTRPVDFNLNF